MLYKESSVLLEITIYMRYKCEEYFFYLSSTARYLKQFFCNFFLTYTYSFYVLLNIRMFLAIKWVRIILHWANKNLKYSRIHRVTLSVCPSIMSRRILTIFVKKSLVSSCRSAIPIIACRCKLCIAACISTVTVKLSINDNSLSREAGSTTRRTSGVNQSIPLLVL